MLNSNVFRQRGLWIFLVALVVYSLCPPFTSYDSYWSVPVALNLLEHGRTTIDGLVDAAPYPAQMAAECVPQHGKTTYYRMTVGCEDGHLYNTYPVAISVLAAPVILILKVLATIFGPLVPRSVLSISNIVQGFFSGDFRRGHALVELWTASFFGALAVWVQYRILMLLLPAFSATILALVFAFGTSEWSVASRSLLQHGLSVLMLSIALYLLLRSLDEPRLVQFASIPVAIAFTVRPTNAIAVLVVTIFVAIHCRKYLLHYLGWSLVVAVPFLSYNLLVRHSLFPLYYMLSPTFALTPRYHSLGSALGDRSFLRGLNLHLFSPSRGLFPFTPIAIISVIGIGLAIGRRWVFPLSPYLAAILFLHTLVVASWWPGHGYGPRYFADMSPLLVLFLVPPVLYWSKMQGVGRTAAAALFFALALWGVFTHGRGATSIAANQWSATPESVDTSPGRVWDWKDPQFLRGL